MKTNTIQIDTAGRVVLPKLIRDRFNLLPGDKLRLTVEGNGIKLEPTDPVGTLVRKGNVLVFRGNFADPITTQRVEAMIQQEREARVSEPLHGLRRK
jgi:AbrB family looped-hinge helix DNA binding protein